jgi:SNF2 family DNA or RNA helicase
LITGGFDKFEKGISGKFDALMDLIQQIVEGENSADTPNKLLAFSQYVPMASYIQEFITSQKRTCDRIDGSVSPSNRPALCKTFNNDPSRFGMVLTLFSGGVGLDLQSANHVILYDQWWNPAVHDQAIDRVHRIGQVRSVLVFYFITRGTLEEKIEAKLRNKKDIFDFTIKADELLKKEISRDDLMDLVNLDA